MKHILTMFLLATLVTSVVSQENIVVDDFENGNKGWSIVDPGWMTLEIVDNPLSGAINPSAKVAKCIRKPTSKTWAGAILRGKFEIPVGSGVGEYRYAHIKFMKTSKGKVGFKIEGGPGNASYGADMPCNSNGEWVEVVFDLGAANPGIYKNFFFMVDQTDGIKEDVTVYVDDIVLMTDPDAKPDVDDRPGTYKVVWQDEFDGTQLDKSKWSYELGTGDWGWGNDEKQYYTDRPENLFLRDGKLVIKAIKESYRGSEYTSARILTRGKADWLYGKMEAKLKLPKGRGIWPAFWMMPAESRYGGWPNSGEIDIMEYVGYDPGKAHGTVHTQGGSGGSASGGSFVDMGMEDDFHVFTLEWTPNFMKWTYDDDEPFKTYRRLDGWTNVYWPFDQNFYIILNQAVGGLWGGSQGIDNTIFPQEYQIEYIRVYQKVDDPQKIENTFDESSLITVVKENQLYVSGNVPLDSIVLYDLNGRQVRHLVTSVSSVSIDIAQLPAGLYVIRINSGNSQITRKIIK